MDRETKLRVWHRRTTMSAELAERYALLRQRELLEGVLERAAGETGINFQGKVVLDLAAGPGCWTAVLAHKGASPVIWMDSCKHMLRHARHLHRQLGVTVKHVVASMDSIPVVAQAVDVVVFHEAIYHAASEPAVCREIARILREGGVLWLTTRSAGRLLKERRAWWKKPLLWVSPWLALVLGRKLLPTPFVLLWRLRVDLARAGLRVILCRRVGYALYEVVAIKECAKADGSRNHAPEAR